MYIKNVSVSGLSQSFRNAQFPKSLNPDNVKDYILPIHRSLGTAETGSGHDCFLKGIIIHADLRASQVFWQQWQRYHFQDIISSQSKMHMILEMDISEQCNKYVDEVIINHIRNKIMFYNNFMKGDEDRKELWKSIIYNLPMGLELTAGVVTNYLQLKTVYHQRRNHKLDEWQEICDWIETLPYFDKLIL